METSPKNTLVHSEQICTKIMPFLFCKNIFLFTHEKRKQQFNFSRQKCRKLLFFLGHRQTEIRRRYTITNDARSKANEISTASLCCQVCMRRFDVKKNYFLSYFEIISRDNLNC